MQHTSHYPDMQTSRQIDDYRHMQGVKKQSSVLSPRQQFHSRIRHLSDDGENDFKSAPSPKPEQRLQHISSLRVQALPNIPKQTELSRRVRVQPTHGRTVRAAHDEPAFILEERAAWNRGSPAVSKVWQHQEAEDIQLKSARDRYYENKESRNPETQHECNRAQWHPPLLRPFAPLSSTVDVEDRPKTSKGPRSGVQEFSIQEDRPTTANTSHSVRRSKFVEGSMNDRSVAVASCYQNPTYSAFPTVPQKPSSTVPEIDHSSKPAHHDQDSDSIDLTDFKPLPAAPTGSLKQRFFHFGNSSKPTEDSHKIDEGQPTRLKKRLRKSVSSWNLHNLGGKMKIFGASTHELDPSNNDTHEPVKKPKGSAANDEAESLQDRKRKAQEAYSQQFGFKKQKSNAGLAAVPTHTNDATPSKQRKPRLTKERSLSAIRSSALSSSSSSTAIRPKTPQIDPFLHTIQNPTAKEIDRNKRLSRKQLEKENLRLRALLREQERDQSDPGPGIPGITNLETQRYRSASISAVHLPLDQTAEKLVDSVDPTKKSLRRSHQRIGENVPPLPPLPDAKVLSQLGNPQMTGLVAGGKVAKKSTSNFSRPVSMIMEVDEGDENRVMDMGPLQRREPWEWPDDVF